MDSPKTRATNLDFILEFLSREGFSEAQSVLLKEIETKCLPGASPSNSAGTDSYFQESPPTAEEDVEPANQDESKSTPLEDPLTSQRYSYNLLLCL